MVEIAVWWGALTGLTVVLISTVSPVELLVAATAALGAAVTARAMRRAAGVRWRGGRGAARAVLHLPWAVLHGCGTLLAAAVRRPGRATVRRTTVQQGTEPGWAGVVLAASPDTCVLDMPHEDDPLLHTLGGRPGPAEQAVTGAREQR
ncbi:hypothetical protein [Kitasatospora sp. DSM 101779]|uniref:hypothetical protein n=1 Tax=Kitasatospora sp. DSM 101779 TaxID=2853165 RepID=UPI0021D9753B|nr:hypothetical protein [Kitasatospora sp. DSM 101779]MCU7826732.1 hypothetical protein [Kitasatospora sp. DSM 101779]